MNVLKKVLGIVIIENSLLISKKKLEDNVSLKDIDMILWNYYKGDNELIADALGQIK